MPNVTLPDDLRGFCIFEIDTPNGHLCGSRFIDTPPHYSGPFRPCLRTITIATFGKALLAYLTNAGIDHTHCTGHITTNDGIAIDISDLCAEYANRAELAILFNFEF
jgi:hypothetical protein